MLKILVKAAILVFIILSVYFIVHPQACSNLAMGRVTHTTDKVPAVEDHGELFTPVGDQPLHTAPADAQGVFDTNTLNEPQPAASQYSQEDIDYAIASRYVELEGEYAKNKIVGKDASKEISSTVMDDFELSKEEWEAFLQRATSSDLFSKVRRDMATSPAL